MIIAPEWIWLHLPKCAGTETEQILRGYFAQDPSVRFDPVGPGHPAIWHHTLKIRSTYDPDFSAAGRRVYYNIRRLPHWILSRVHFEVQRSGNIALVNRNQLVTGTFRNPPGPSGAVGQLFRADQIVERFKLGVTDWIRTEFLDDDLRRSFGVTEASSRAAANQNRFGYIRPLEFWFTPTDLDFLYESNPIWRDLETEVYGDVIRL